MGALTAAEAKGAVFRERTMDDAPRTGADHFHDRHGLYLQVRRSGARQWVQRIMLDGVRRDYGIGPYHEVGLAEAREQALANLAEAQAYRRARARHKRRGGEPPPLPSFERRRRAARGRSAPGAAPVQAAPAYGAGLLFEEAWRQCVAERSRGWKNPDVDRRSWFADLTHHLGGVAGLPVAAVTVDHLREVLKPLKAATADKVLRRCGTVFDWSIAGGHRHDNPARTLRATWRGLSNGERQHRKAIPWAEVPAFYTRLREHSTDGAAGALALVVLTALRSKEGRLARWEEIDFDTRTWSVPASRMKDSAEFRVPLSTAALEVLEAAGPRRESGLVFTTKNGKEVTDKALRAVLADLGADATVHGLRSSFRDWAGDTAAAPRELSEMALAHKPQGVEAAYARSQLLDRRRELMQAWGRFVEGAA